jgi:hypothetical protein
MNLDSMSRITVTQALEHHWFGQAPQYISDFERQAQKDFLVQDCSAIKVWSGKLWMKVRQSKEKYYVLCWQTR